MQTTHCFTKCPNNKNTITCVYIDTIKNKNYTTFFNNNNFNTYSYGRYSDCKELSRKVVEMIKNCWAKVNENFTSFDLYINRNMNSLNDKNEFTIKQEIKLNNITQSENFMCHGKSFFSDLFDFYFLSDNHIIFTTFIFFIFLLLLALIIFLERKKEKFEFYE